MLVSQQDLVEIHRDGHLVVFEIAEPCSLGTDGVADQRQDVHQRECNILAANGSGGDVDAGKFIARPVIDAKLG